jgi:hypothetical protein
MAATGELSQWPVTVKAVVVTGHAMYMPPLTCSVAPVM